MKHPDALSFILLALAAFRVTRLVGWDDLTIPIRRWATGIGDADHHRLAHYIDELRQQGLDPWDPRTAAGGDVPVLTPQRFYFSKLIRCPWCVGFWISLAVWVYWLAVPSVAVGLSVPLALSAIVGLTAKQLDP